MEQGISAEQHKAAPPRIFRLAPALLRQVVAAVAAWVRTRGAPRARIVDANLIVTTEGDEDPSADRSGRVSSTDPADGG